jgi:hypothetical protein
MTTAPVTSVALIDGIDVDAVAAAVAACPGVSGLFGGRGNAIASYLPGRRVAGVEVNPTTVTIHVRSRWGIPAAQLLTQIAAAVSALLHGHHLEVVVADIDDAEPPALQEALTPLAPVVPATPALSAPTTTTPSPDAAQPTPVPAEPIVDPMTIDGPPGALPRSTVRPPGSAPAPTTPSPTPAPPTFPTA